MSFGRRVVSVFGSSQTPPACAEYEDSRRLGFLLAEAGYTVCSGGYGGLMEAVSRGAKEAGGWTIGVTCSIFTKQPGPNPYIDEEIRTATLLERLERTIAVAEAHVALPGGPGTLAEIGITWNLKQLRVIAREAPFILVGERWAELASLLQRSPWVRPQDMRLLTVARNGEEAFRLIADGNRTDS